MILKFENLSILGHLDQISFTAIPNLTSLRVDRFKTAYKIINEILVNDFMTIRLPSIIGLIAVYLAYKEKTCGEIVGCALTLIDYIV